MEEMVAGRRGPFSRNEAAIEKCGVVVVEEVNDMICDFGWDRDHDQDNIGSMRDRQQCDEYGRGVSPRWKTMVVDKKKPPLPIPSEEGQSAE
jgi:hypothetical protein